MTTAQIVKDTEGVNELLSEIVALVLLRLGGDHMLSERFFHLAADYVRFGSDAQWEIFTPSPVVKSASAEATPKAVGLPQVGI